MSLYRTIVNTFPLAGAAFHAVQDLRAQMAVPKPTPHGFRFHGAAGMMQGTFEPEETRLIRRLVAGVDVFVNIGANTGYYCCFARQQGKSVVAFEPDATNARQLLRNLRANGWMDDVELLPVALSDRPGILELYGAGTGASLVKGWAGVPERDVQLVPVNTWDALFGARFANVKCLVLLDVEGSEYQVLRGATSLLDAKVKPVWMVEICVSEHQSGEHRINPRLRQTFELFWSRGYDSFTADQRVQSITANDIEQVMATGVNSLGAYNFLFVAREQNIRELTGLPA